MKIIISAHTDTVKKNFHLSFENGIHKGLLDNYIGQIVSYLTCYQNESMMQFCKNGDIVIWHNNTEEFGILSLPQVDKKDIVIVVDVCCGKQYNGFDFSLENIYGFDDKKIKEVKENLEWEGFKVRTKKYTGEVDDEDEAFQWVERKQRVMTFIIPIDGGKDAQWHTDKCLVSVDKVHKCVEGLTRLICYIYGA